MPFVAQDTKIPEGFIDPAEERFWLYRELVLQ